MFGVATAATGKEEETGFLVGVSLRQNFTAVAIFKVVATL